MGMQRTIDLRSDTVTVPTPKMRRAMAEAEVGDDVFREDPTVLRLQERAAETFGREAALFVPTGTMGNQIAVKLHTRPGQEIIIEARGHIYNWEMAAMATVSGCIARPLEADRGFLDWKQIENAISPQIYYRAQTGLIALENTHNMAGGTCMTSEQTRAVTSAAHKRGIPVHLDGARIFNAAVALGCDVKELTHGCDSVMFCLSKGLAAPVGSLLVGDRAFIEEAWSVRKMLGGGMRQVGILAAAGLIALEEMPQRLEQDHASAKRLAEGLAELKPFSVSLEEVQTNIVIADVCQFDSTTILEKLREEGVLAVPTSPTQIRLVTHKDVSRSDIDKTLETARRLFG